MTQFYDYVAIEASSDLQNWIEVDKYDSRRFADWLAKSVDPFAFLTDNLFKEQSINLVDKGLNLGDTFVFRFKLVSNGNGTSLGWAVKWINATTASARQVLDNEKTFTVYPTISNGNFTIFGNYSLGKSKVQLVDLTGREVYNNTLDFSNQNEHQISINTRSGVYILTIVDDSNRRKSEKLIIK